MTEFILMKNVIVFMGKAGERSDYMVLLGMHTCTVSLHIRHYLSLCSKNWLEQKYQKKKQLSTTHIFLVHVNAQ